MSTQENQIEELPPHTCWALLHAANVGRLAVWVEDHPDIFPINYVVDQGTLVFRSAAGTKVAGAITGAAVALEIDGHEDSPPQAWSVVVKGRAEQIRETQELVDTLDLPLFPWQAGTKGKFIRIVPDLVTGRRFPIADPAAWQTSLSTGRRAPLD